MPSDLLTVPEAAERLHVSVRTVYEWVSSGRLPALRLSPRCTRLPAAGVDALLEAARVPQRPDLSPLLWDVPAADIDEARDADFLIVRILTAGRPEHVAWMFRRYPRERIDRLILADRRLPARVAGGWMSLLALEPADLEPAEGVPRP